MNGKTQQLVEFLSKLPGVGPRHATRIMLALLRWDKKDVQELSNAISQMKDGVKLCKNCQNISDQDECQICLNPKRDNRTICVVEKVTDLETIEKNGAYKGVYHVLGGAINPLEKVLPQNLNILNLIQRIQRHPSNELEIILATNPNTHGETTALYIEEQLKPFSIKITRLGRGLSSGSYLEYTDERTLENAFNNRK